MDMSNHLFLIIFLMASLNPVETIAPTKKTNLKHCLSEIIFVSMANLFYRLTDSNPPDWDISKIFKSIDMSESISVSFT